MNNTSKTAFIAIVGKANVGKSSILNKLIGSKIAIVSSKPQTTRTRIMGVLTTEDNIQLVFTDTPGFHKPKNKLGEKMVQAVSDSISGVDSCLLVVDANDEKLNTAELELIKKFNSLCDKLAGSNERTIDSISNDMLNILKEYKARKIEQFVESTQMLTKNKRHINDR